MIIVLWGVSGCGKTTVGQHLKEELGWLYLDADDYHPAANVEKMRQGIPLCDEDRWPWLDKLAERLRHHEQIGEHIILSCSALKQIYRDHLSAGLSDLVFVQLHGSFELIKSRLEIRQHEFMNNSLLQSQFETLEPDPNAVQVHIDQSIADICSSIKQQLKL